jgi:hypothetical protein
VVPAGGNAYVSNSALTGGGTRLQVLGHGAGYPQTDYTNSAFHPSQGGGTNYSGFPAGDGANHVRYHQRAIDTGFACNTGWIRLRGLTQGNFQATGAYDGTQTTGHTGGGQGAIIQLAVPGTGGTGWLDLGRQLGDPGLGTGNYYGCQTGIIQVDGSQDIYVSYNTQAFTSFNGSPYNNWLLFIRVILINGAGTYLLLQEYEWYPPTFIPPGQV